MKTLILLLQFIGLSASTFAQIQITGFENWNNTGSYETATGWISFYDEYFPSTGSASINKVTDAQSGMYAAKVEVSGTPGHGVAGLISLGTDLFSNGVPFTNRPSFFSFWMKYHLEGSDSINAEMTFRKFNQQFNGSDFIGRGSLTLTGEQINFKQFIMPIDFISSNDPDTVSLLFSVGDLSNGMLGGTLGSYFIVDNLSLIIPTGLEITNMNIIPNPAIDNLEILLPKDLENANIQIIDMHGRVVYNGIQTKINVSSFNGGLYIILVSNNDRIMNRKLIIE